MFIGFISGFIISNFLKNKLILFSQYRLDKGKN